MLELLERKPSPEEAIGRALSHENLHGMKRED